MLEHDHSRQLPRMNPIDPTRQVARAARFSSFANSSVSKRPIWLVDAPPRSTALPPTIHQHRGIAPETLGVVHILVSGEASIRQTGEAADDAMPAVLARPAVGQDIARQCGQPQGIVSSR